MALPATAHITPEAYLAFERSSRDEKRGYLQGELRVEHYGRRPLTGVYFTVPFPEPES